MARSTLAKLITATGLALLLGALVLFTNGYFCTFNKLSCGMVEPILGIPVAVAGVGVLAFGIWAMRHGRR